jgi:tRNA pseudouridine38-40 synthase
MPSFRVTVAYDGTDFVGWQRQASGTSIQGLLEEALRALDERDVRVTGAGRTDAGVHALGQVAAFSLTRALPADTIAGALNARLPDAVRVLAAVQVPPSFHPRFDARTKTYRYRIWNGDVLSPFERRYAWHRTGALNVDAMQQAAQLLAGEHDFAAFMGTGSDVVTTVRRVLVSRIADCGLRIDCGFPIADLPRSAIPNEWEIRNESALRHESAIRNTQSALLCYDITGTGFLRHMVRTIVGSLIEIGCGRRPTEWMTHVLDSRDRAQAGPTAPAMGLFLVGVDYGGTLATEP